MTDEDDLTAGELALGLLEGDERAAALRLVIADPAFARAVERWRDRFAGLAGGWRPAAPDAAIEARVLRAAGRGGANDDHPWRWVAAATSLAAAALLAVVVARPAPAPPAATPALPAPAGPLLVAVFAPDGTDPFGAIYDPRGRAVRLSGMVTVPTARQLELWAIGGDGVPHAAGLLPPGGGRVALGRGVAIGAGTTLAISIEPVGGSPGPTPTGPVVATGKLTTI